MQLFYTAELTPETISLSLNKEESRHLTKVLRKKEGDQVQFTDGKGYAYEMELTLATTYKCQLEVINVTQKEPLPYRLHMAVAPTKMNDRYEWFLEKATELGVSKITPIICSRSERKVIKIARYQKIVESAMKQSLQYHLPILHAAVTFSDFVHNHSGKQTFIAHCEETERKPLAASIVKTDAPEVTILIGPEGDFSDREIEMALANKYLPVHLGRNRLRTETAAITAVHTVALAYP